MLKTQRMEHLIKAFNEPTALCRAITTKFKGKLGIFMGVLKKQLEVEQAAARKKAEELRLTESDDSDDNRLQVLFEQQSQLLQQIDKTKEERKFEDLRTLQDNLEIVNKLIEEI